MKMLGLIGGMSWESTAVYYRLLNEGARKRLGGLHSARLLLWSFDFAAMANLQTRDDWDALTTMMIEAGQTLHRGGADALIICSNTMHIAAPAMTNALSIPVIHIADATGDALRSAKCRHPVLLGTRFTMEQGFYVDHLRNAYGIEPIIPDEPSRAIIHRVIYEQLCRGIITPESKHNYLAIIDALRQRGADGVIFGCTEIMLLLSQSDVDIPVFDTTAIHAEAALDFTLSAPSTLKVGSST
jgi:aspartate racemase